MKPSNWIERIRRIPWLDERSSPLTDPAAFEEVYERTHVSIYRYIYGLTGGPATRAEDLTAETFLRAWKYRSTYIGRSNEAIGWLIRLARNLVIDEYRRSAIRPEVNDPALEEVQAVEPDCNPEMHIILTERQRILFNLLKGLAPDVREMLVLRYLLDMKINDIAKQLNMAPNTVSVSIRRALEKIQHAWPAESEERP